MDAEAFGKFCLILAPRDAAGALNVQGHIAYSGVVEFMAADFFTSAKKRVPGKRLNLHVP